VNTGGDSHAMTAAESFSDVAPQQLGTVAKPRPLPITVPERPEALWPAATDGRANRRAQLLALAALAIGVGYLLVRVLATLSPLSLALGVPLLILELWSLVSFSLAALALWDLDSTSRPEPVTETGSMVAVLIPTFDEPHHILLPTLMAAARMRLATQVIVLDDGHRLWLAGTCEELGIEYRPRLRHLGGRAGQLNSALDTLTTDFVVVLDPDQVATRDFIGHTLPHFDNAEVALVQTPRDSYSMDSFEHVAAGRRRLSERALRARVFGAGRNRWNSAFWSGGAVILRRAALTSIDGFVAVRRSRRCRTCEGPPRGCEACRSHSRRPGSREPSLSLSPCSQHGSVIGVRAPVRLDGPTRRARPAGAARPTGGRPLRARG
jgi:hypothetical protein